MKQKTQDVLLRANNNWKKASALVNSVMIDQINIINHNLPLKKLCTYGMA